VHSRWSNVWGWWMNRAAPVTLRYSWWFEAGSHRPSSWISSVVKQDWMDATISYKSFCSCAWKWFMSLFSFAQTSLTSKLWESTTFLRTLPLTHRTSGYNRVARVIRMARSDACLTPVYWATSETQRSTLELWPWRYALFESKVFVSSPFGVFIEKWKDSSRNVGNEELSIVCSPTWGTRMYNICSQCVPSRVSLHSGHSIATVIFWKLFQMSLQRSIYKIYIPKETFHS
jgi:hypothetical protein